MTVVFMYAVGHATLSAWNQEVTGQATLTYGGVVQRCLGDWGGYLVELSGGGLCLAAFAGAAEAVGFALSVKDRLLVADWWVCRCGGTRGGTRVGGSAVLAVCVRVRVSGGREPWHVNDLPAPHVRAPSTPKHVHTASVCSSPCALQHHTYTHTHTHMPVACSCIPHARC